MDVAGAIVVGVLDDLLHETHDERIVGLFFTVAGAHLDVAGHLADHLIDLRLGEAEVLLDADRQLARAGQGDLDLQRGLEAQGVDQFEIERVGHRHRQHLAGQADRHDLALATESLGDELEHRRGDVVRLEVDEAHVELLGQGARDVLGRDGAALDEDLADRALVAGVHLLVQRGLDLLLRRGFHLDQDLAEELAHASLR